MKLKKPTIFIITAVMFAVLSGCTARNEYTYEDIKFSVSSDFEHEHGADAEIFKTDDAEIIVKQQESELRRLIHDKAYVEEYDVEYTTDTITANDIYYAVTYMERSELKGGTVRFNSIEYSFNVSGKNYILLIEDVIDVIDIEPYKEELEKIIETVDVSWAQKALWEETES